MLSVAYGDYSVHLDPAARLSGSNTYLFKTCGKRVKSRRRTDGPLQPCVILLRRLLLRFSRRMALPTAGGGLPRRRRGAAGVFLHGRERRPRQAGGGRPSHVASNVSSMCNCHAEEGGKRPQSAAAPGADLGTRAPGCSESRKGALLAKAVNYDASTRATGGSPQASRRLA